MENRKVVNFDPKDEHPDILKRMYEAMDELTHKQLIKLQDQMRAKLKPKE